MAVRSHQLCALPQGLRYYISRDNVMVPLVPVDQLPFQLLGLPRHLTPRQMAEDSWKFIGETQEPSTPLPIQAPTAFPSQPVPLTKTVFLSPDHNVRKDLVAAAGHPQPPRWSSPISAGCSEAGVSHSKNVSSSERSVADTMASLYTKDAQRIGYRTPPPSGIEPDPTKKEYCTHWIATGECKYVSIGCRYKHVMPSVEKLHSLGFAQGYPRWYKEKTAISAARGPSWMQRRMAQDNDNQELLPEPPASRAFPDPSTFANRRPESRSVHGVQEEHGCGHPAGTAVHEKQTISAKMPKPTLTQEKVRASDEIMDLIDLDDTPIDTPAPPSSPRASVSSSSSAVSCKAISSSIPASIPLFQFPASEPGSKVEEAYKIDKPFKVKNEPRSTECSSQVSWASDSEASSEPSKPLSKHRSNPRKPAERAATPSPREGLADSKHATGRKSKRADTLSKGEGKCRSSQRKGKGLQSEITQLKRAVHARERLGKSAASSDVPSRNREAAVSDQVTLT